MKARTCESNRNSGVHTFENYAFFPRKKCTSESPIKRTTVSKSTSTIQRKSVQWCTLIVHHLRSCLLWWGLELSCGCPLVSSPVEWNVPYNIHIINCISIYSRDKSIVHIWNIPILENKPLPFENNLHPLSFQDKKIYIHYPSKMNNVVTSVILLKYRTLIHYPS